MEPEPSIATTTPIATASPIHTLTLDSTHSASSRITNISLYADRAQITRSYNIRLNAGQTKLTLAGLPNVVDHESIRVEGRGNAIIQGVSAFKADFEPLLSPLLEELQAKKAKALSAFARYQKTINAIDKYMDNINIEHLDISKLGEAMDMYDATEEKWEDRRVQGGKEVEMLTELINVEVRRLKGGEEGMGGNGNLNLNKRKLRTKVEMGLYAEEAGEVEVVLIYAVSNASWEAGYDIRVDMQTPNAPVKVVYKADIHQRTGEAWENVPLTLETAQPTFGLELPYLAPWNITHQPPSSDTGLGGLGLGQVGGKRPRKMLRDMDDEDYIKTQTSYVTSKGRVNATFRVPGLVSVPSDKEHGVVIADLELEAEVRWVGVPKGGRKVFLEANITNSSEYTFLPGPGNVYVDQSFISRSDIPGVSPKEVFQCALGVDPSIRVTYHPQEKLISESGFYNKSLRYTFTQRISIHNTKSIAVEGVRMTDNIPVSQDANISVTLVEPALTLPVSAPVGGALPSVKVMEGVVAMWNGTDEEGQGKDVAALGKDGKIDWVCAVPAFGRVELVLKWEVGTGVRTEIYGL